MPNLTVVQFWLRSRARGFENFEYYDRLVSGWNIEQSEHWLERLYRLDRTSRIPVSELLKALDGIVGVEE
jgi:hypothetical protein